jgi:hypothetical protein
MLGLTDEPDSRKPGSNVNRWKSDRKLMPFTAADGKSLPDFMCVKTCVQAPGPPRAAVIEDNGMRGSETEAPDSGGIQIARGTLHQARPAALSGLPYGADMESGKVTKPANLGYGEKADSINADTMSRAGFMLER